MALSIFSRMKSSQFTLLGHQCGVAMLTPRDLKILGSFFLVAQKQMVEIVNIANKIKKIDILST